MLICDSHRIKDLGVNLVIVDIDKIHLFADALECCFRAELRQIRTHKTVSILSYCLKVNVWGEFHVSGMNAQDFHSANLIRNTNVDFSVEATSARAANAT